MINSRTYNLQYKWQYTDLHTSFLTFTSASCIQEAKDFPTSPKIYLLTRFMLGAGNTIQKLHNIYDI